MSSVNVTVRIDEETKREFDCFCNNVGINITTAFNMFIKATLRTRELPFSVTDNDTDQFHKLIDDIRTENEKKGFLSDDEINAEIQAYRNEQRRANT